MELKSFQDILTPDGQAALQAAMVLQPHEADFLSHFTTLSRRFPRDLARATLETAILRAEAIKKFPFADKLYFTREALEQASSYTISKYRSQRYQPFSRVADLGCSIGGDTLALAEHSFTVGIDKDVFRLQIARANMSALGLADKTLFLQADLNRHLPLAHTPSRTALFCDPARRSQGRRIFTIRDYQPPLSSLFDWLLDFPALGVKISPGVNLDELSAYDCEVEFISLKGELKEAVLWFGPLKTARRRATLLPAADTLVSDEGNAAATEEFPISAPLAFLYEPDPAVLRAGLVRKLGEQLGAAQIDADIAYLTAPARHATPFARVWAVEAWFTFNLKHLRAYLRERQVGQVVVKKRGSPLEPQALIRQLRLQGENERVIFLTHLKGEPIVVVAFTSIHS